MITNGQKRHEVVDATTAKMAKRIRHDIASAIKEGRLQSLKFTVRAPRRGVIYIRVQKASFQVYADGHFETIRLKKVCCDAERYTEKGKAALDVIHEIAEKYRQEGQLDVGLRDSRVEVDVKVTHTLREMDWRAYEERLWASGVPA